MSFQRYRTLLLGLVGMVVASQPVLLYGQFSQQGFFTDLLNQALPKVAPNQPYSNQGFPSGVPTSSNTMPSNGPMASSGYAAPWPTDQISGRPRDWKLGVALDNTDTGAIVRQVQPGSPAERARVEVGDVIIAMGGSQVGYVNGRLNDVGDQIRRSADNNGRVRTLVFDNRSGRLANIDIDLDSASTGVTGTVFTRDRANLPFGSVMTVKLENATRPFFEVNGGTDIRQVQGPGPHRFEMHYDPNFIASTDQYRLTASVSDNRGQLLYAMRQPLVVSPSRWPSNINLELESFRDLQFGSSGGVITASYPPNPNDLNQIYMQLLNRLPSPKEQVAWSAYLSQGNSINDLKAKILGSPNFYDRVGNNPTAFVQTMIQLLTNQQPSSQQIAAWTNRLQQYQGQREEVVREFLQQMR
jgi:hypothetical protein